MANNLIQSIRETKNAFSVRQLAQRLSMSPRTIYEHLERGSLPHLRIGKLIRLDPQAVADWLEASFMP
jgi:excisionase family DNA binding protein